SSNLSSCSFRASTSLLSLWISFSNSLCLFLLLADILLILSVTTSGWSRTRRKALHIALSKRGASTVPLVQFLGRGYRAYLSEHLYLGLPWQGYPYIFLPHAQNNRPFIRYVYFVFLSDISLFLASFCWAALNSSGVIIAGTLIGIQSFFGLRRLELLTLERRPSLFLNGSQAMCLLK